MGSRRGPCWLHVPNPCELDMLLTLSFLIDTAGNAVDLHDTLDWVLAALPTSTVLRQRAETSG